MDLQLAVVGDLASSSDSEEEILGTSSQVVFPEQIPRDQVFRRFSARLGGKKGGKEVVPLAGLCQNQVNSKVFFGREKSILEKISKGRKLVVFLLENIDSWSYTKG